jgi:hypothetical protein
VRSVDIPFSYSLSLYKNDETSFSATGNIFNKRGMKFIRIQCCVELEMCKIISISGTDELTAYRSIDLNAMQVISNYGALIVARKKKKKKKRR